MKHEVGESDPDTPPPPPNKHTHTHMVTHVRACTHTYNSYCIHRQQTNNYTKQNNTIPNFSILHVSDQTKLICQSLHRELLNPEDNSLSLLSKHIPKPVQVGLSPFTCN